MDKKINPNQARVVGRQFSRRDFLYTSSLAFAALALPNFSGCTKRYPKNDCLSITGGVAAEAESSIFKEALLGRIRVKNRLIRSATTLGSADQFGRPTERLLDQYAELAKGGVGTIITGMGDSGLLLDLDAYREDDMAEYGKVAQLVHTHKTTIIQQIGHQGSQAGLPGSNAEPFSLNGLDDSEIEVLINGFVTAIRRSKQTGFDGVQLHGAHGYLLSEFLSPAVNLRTDKWGGTTENRFRIIKEIFIRARKLTGDFPIFIKINAYDFQKGGMRIDEAVKIAKLLEEAGCDGIEVSSGVGKDGFSTIRVSEIPTDAIIEFTRYGDNISDLRRAISPVLLRFFIKRYHPLYNYNVCAAKTIKQHVNIPVIVVGGIHRKTDALQIINQGMADFVAMGRPFIIEPNIINQFKNNVQTVSECISCGFCIVSLADRPVECFYGSV